MGVEQQQQLGLIQSLRAAKAEGLLHYEAQRVFPVHRLDTPTSGIVLLAKSSHAAGSMVQAFRRRQVAKYYVALSGRKPKKKEGSVVGLII